MTNYGRFTVKCQLFLFVCLPHGGSDPHHNCVFKHVKSSMAWRIGGVGGAETLLSRVTVMKEESGGGLGSLSVLSLGILGPLH